MMNKDKNIKQIIDDLSSGRKKIEELTSEEKKSVYHLLNIDLVKKEIKLKDLKNEIIYNELEEHKNVEKALNTMSERDKKNFIEYLNNKL